MIIANDIIEHLKKDEIVDFLDLIYSSLKKGGLALIGTCNSMSLLGSITIFDDFTHETGFTPNSLAQIMQICNFNNIKVYGEYPVIHNFRSAIRMIICRIITSVLRIYTIIEKGNGRDFRKEWYIFEPRIFAIGEKN
jgi:hypothetical protein